MGELVGTFPRLTEFEKAKAIADSLGIACRIVSAEPGYRHVGVPALVLNAQVRADLLEHGDNAFTCSGWVDYRPASCTVPTHEPAAFVEDVFGQAGIMVLAPCIADASKIRLIAHISGDLTEVLPYLNTEMRQASYNKDGPNLTFMDGYRMVSVYPNRIAIAKADEIVDGWRVLEMIRCRVNENLVPPQLGRAVVREKGQAAGPGDLLPAAQDQLPGLRGEDVHGVRPDPLERQRGPLAVQAGLRR